VHSVLPDRQSGVSSRAMNLSAFGTRLQGVKKLDRAECTQGRAACAMPGTMF